MIGLCIFAIILVLAAIASVMKWHHQQHYQVFEYHRSPPIYQEPEETR